MKNISTPLLGFSFVLFLFFFIESCSSPEPEKKNEEEVKATEKLKETMPTDVYIPIDSIWAIDSAESRIVKAGEFFISRLSVGGLPPDYPFAEFIGEGVTTEEKGKSATLKIKATGKFPPGKNEVEQFYKATIRVPKTDGSVTEVYVNGKFVSRK